jgi:hypothetical protein
MQGFGWPLAIIGFLASRPVARHERAPPHGGQFRGTVGPLVVARIAVGEETYSSLCLGPGLLSNRWRRCIETLGREAGSRPPVSGTVTP